MPERVENPMVIDALWEVFEKKSECTEYTDRLDGPGWEEIGTGVFVPEENAFDYALEQCIEEAPEFAHRLKWTQEFRDMLVEWFYSGNWVKEE